MAPIELLSDCKLPCEYGKECQLRVYGDPEEKTTQHWVACLWGSAAGDDDSGEGVHLRVHDACLTSEILGSLKCDCAQQLRLSQKHLSSHGGVLIYTPQEGRGIGLASKVAAYALQERGLDTVDANVALGLPAEARDYTAVRTILDHIGVKSVKLLTNNPFKVESLEALGVHVVSRLALVASEVAPQCHAYLRAKARRMAHLLTTGHEKEIPAHFEEQFKEAAAASGGGGSGGASGTAAFALTGHEKEAPIGLDACYAACEDDEDAPVMVAPLASPLDEPPTVPPLPPPPQDMSSGSGAGPPLLPPPPPEPPLLDRVHRRHQEEELKCEELLSGLRAEISRHVHHSNGTATKATGGAGGRPSSLTMRMPFVTLTYAQALDGSIAGPLGAAGPRLLLSGERAMTLTHGLRASHDAILVGVNTLISDDPQLTVRLVDGNSPIRVILDSKLRVPLGARALRKQPSSSSTQTQEAASSSPPPHALIVTLDGVLHDPNSLQKLNALQGMGVTVVGVQADGEHVCLKSALTALHDHHHIQSVMIEGGAAVIGSCAKSRLANRIIVTLAPQTLVNGLRPGAETQESPMAAQGCLKRVQAFCLGDDVVVSGEGPAAVASSGRPLVSKL